MLFAKMYLDDQTSMYNKNESVTYIVPLYNASKTIYSCLQSISKQILVKIKEIIVVDAGSEDDSIFQVRNFINDNMNIAVRLITGLGRLNPAQARNIGLKLANSHYIAFVDADVLLPKQWTVRCLNLIKTNPQAIVFGAVFPAGYIDSLGKLLNLKPKPIKSTVLTASNLFMHYSTALYIGGFNESLLRGEDIALYYVCLQKNISPIFLKDLVCFHKSTEDIFHLSKKMFFSGFSRMLLLLQRRSIRPLKQHWQELGSIIFLSFLVLMMFYPRLLLLFCLFLILLELSISALITMKKFYVNNAFQFLASTFFYAYLGLLFVLGFYTGALKALYNVSKRLAGCM